MSKIRQTIVDVHNLDDLASRDIWMNHIHPLAKVLVTLSYLVLVMSFPKQNLIGLCGMCLYLIVTIILGEIPLWKSLYQLRFVFLGVGLIGIANPFFDRQVVMTIGQIGISSGVISMLTLCLKAGMAVTASYLLIQSTTIEGICYALRKIHVPKMMVTMMMLIHRYMILMLKEVERMEQAYALRAPGQSGIHRRSWGSLVGRMLLRSMDRAQVVYESMSLRGFHGEFYPEKMEQSTGGSILYVVLWITILCVLRIVPIFSLVGGQL